MRDTTYRLFAAFATLTLPVLLGVGLAACDQPKAPVSTGPGALLLTVELAQSGPRLLAQRHVDGSRLAAADRWGNLYFEARDAAGQLLVARDIDAPRAGKEQLLLTLPLRDGRPTELELFALDLTTRTPTKRSLGRVQIHSAPLARHWPAE